MSESSVEVVCADCEYVESFGGLRAAREATAAHEAETDHAVEFEIRRLSSGVERAGDDAGVCGRPGCANPDTPLLGHDAEGAESGGGEAAPDGCDAPDGPDE